MVARRERGREMSSKGLAEIAKVFGRRGLLSVDVGSGVLWGVPCVVVDARVVWGVTQYRVIPVECDAFALDLDSVWVKSDRVSLS